MQVGGKRAGAGRKPGVPNKDKAEIEEKLKALGCDPLEGMAKLALDPNSSPDLKGRMLSELAGYVCAKRKAIEHSGGITVKHEDMLGELA